MSGAHMLYRMQVAAETGSTRTGGSVATGQETRSRITDPWIISSHGLQSYKVSIVSILLP